MRILLAAAALLVGACSSCTALNSSPAPSVTATAPAPSVWPPADGDACGAECANVGALHCPGSSATCKSDCLHLDFVLAEHHQNPVDHACMAAAKSCEEVARCP